MANASNFLILSFSFLSFAFSVCSLLCLASACAFPRLLPLAQLSLILQAAPLPMKIPILKLHFILYFLQSQPMKPLLNTKTNGVY